MSLSVGMQGRLFGRSLLLQSCWNFERMQSLGLAFCLEPWLARCWAGQDGMVREARLRHQEYFNTQPYMASLVMGMVCALEEEAAAAPERRAALLERLRVLKGAAAAALGGIGDALFWGALRPLCAGAAAAGALALRQRPLWAALWAAGAYLALHNALALGLRWRLLRLGYEWREQLAARFKAWPAQRLLRGLRGAGLLLLLAAAAALVQAAPSRQRWLGPAALVGAGLLRSARISAYGIYAAAALAGGAAALAGGL